LCWPFVIEEGVAKARGTDYFIAVMTLLLDEREVSAVAVLNRGVIPHANKANYKKRADAMKSKPEASFHSIIIITSTIKVVFIVLIDILYLYFFPSSLQLNLLLWLTLSLGLLLPLLLLLEIITFVFLIFLLKQVVLRAIEGWWLLFFKEVALLLGLKETTRFFVFGLFLLYWGNLYPLHSFFWILLLDQVKNLKKIIDLEKLKAERLQDNLTDHESNQTLIYPKFFKSNPKTLL
jgi:hypothetical protein